MPERFYRPAAFESFLELVRRATSAETACIVAALVRARGRGTTRSVDLAKLGDAMGGSDADVVCGRVEVASHEFRGAFGVPLLAHSRPDADEAGEFVSQLDPTGADRDVLWLAAPFADVLESTVPFVVMGTAPDPDEVTASWISILARCPGSGRGHHLALRCLNRSPREMADVACLAAAASIKVGFIDDSSSTPELSVLRAELHAGAQAALVVIDVELVSDAGAEDEEDPWDRPAVQTAAPRRSAADERRFEILRGVRNTYLWRAKADLVVDAGLAAFLGGVFGPFAATRQWRDVELSCLAPGIGPVGAAALVARVADPRDAGPLAAMASVAASALEIDIDEAAVFVAGSLSVRRPQAPMTPAGFDARLVVCDEEGQLLLARASELARHGARVLFWGPPGGGKSTFAQALAAAMGRGAQTVTGASILARHWGVTERIIADLWSRAADDGSSLIIDELDSLCGVRDPGASSGNAYLIRTLTNEFLRVFDTYASVPVIATANHLEAIDAAVRRRFTFVVNVRGELTPEAEELAWRLMFDVEPPTGWAPIGANVSDFANAARRCRMLGLLDSSALAAALERSRDARLGPRVPARDKRVLQ